jgi:hypothetical protein
VPVSLYRYHLPVGIESIVGTIETLGLIVGGRVGWLLMGRGAVHLSRWGVKIGIAFDAALRHGKTGEPVNTDLLAVTRKYTARLTSSTATTGTWVWNGMEWNVMLSALIKSNYCKCTAQTHTSQKSSQVEESV